MKEENLSSQFCLLPNKRQKFRSQELQEFRSWLEFFIG